MLSPKCIGSFLNMYMQGWFFEAQNPHKGRPLQELGWQAGERIKTNCRVSKKYCLYLSLIFVKGVLTFRNNMYLKVMRNV